MPRIHYIDQRGSYYLWCVLCCVPLFALGVHVVLIYQMLFPL